ncbi:MAG: phage holin family protein [Bacteroidetes bacterium]|jgi:putative membrane protein|nr:phage holin family protein [Bacteroidota bacterium]MDF1865156.1 phage holin family protein [Saprospiraceae bacterium]
MIAIITKILLNAVAFFLGARFLRGVDIQDFMRAIIVALVMAVLNMSLGLVLKIVSLGLLSWGIFSLILNAILILVADYFLKGFKVDSFWWALALALVVALVNSITYSVFL